MSHNVDQSLQDEIDRAEMIAGIKLGRELINAAMLNPGKVDKNQMMGEIQSLMTPKRFKDLSAADLRKMAFDKYVENASREMMKDTNNNKHDVEILPQHASIANDLIIHWEEKGYIVETTKNVGDTRIAIIHLTW